MEIWRSPYSTQDSPFTASTNHSLTFRFWHCIRDLEKDLPFCHGKDISEIEAHPMQFTVWRYSAKSRLIVEFFSTLIMTGITTVFVAFIMITAMDVIRSTWGLLDREA